MSLVGLTGRSAGDVQLSGGTEQVRHFTKKVRDFEGLSDNPLSLSTVRSVT